MSDLNIQKGNDPNAGWVNNNSENDAQRTENAKVINSQSYVSTILKSEQVNEQVDQSYKSNAEANNPKLPPQSPNAADPGPVLRDLYSPANFQKAAERLLAQQEIPGASKEEIEAYKNVPVTDKEVQDLGKQLGLPAALVLKNIKMQSNFTFEQAVKLGVTPEQADQLMFAHYFPEYATTLSPNLKALLNKFQEETNESVNKGYGFPEDWSAETDNSEFAETLNSDYNNTFEEVLAKRPDLNNQQIASLRSMFYGQTPPNADSLKEIFSQVMQQTSAEMNEKYGVPADFKFTPNSESYNQTLNGAYRMAFQQNLNSHVPPLNADQKALIQKLIENPKLASSMPPEIQALAEEIQTLSISDVQEKFGLPKTWIPGVDKLTSPLVDPKMQNIAENGLAQAKEVYIKIAQAFGLTPFSETQGTDENEIKNQLSAFAPISGAAGKSGQNGEAINGDSKSGSLKSKGEATAGDIKTSLNNLLALGKIDGADRAMYLDYLKAIGIAILKVQNMIYQIQGANTDAAKNAANVKMDMQLNSLEKQREQIEEMRNQHEKAAMPGPLNDILGWVTKIMIVVIAAILCMVTGGLSMVLAAAYIADSIQSEARGEPSLFQMMTKAISDGVGSNAGCFINLFLVALLSGGNPLLIASLLQDANVVQEGVALCGGGKLAQEITAMVVQMLIQLLVMIIMIICTGGVNVPSLAASAMTAATTISLRVAMMIAKLISIIFEIIMMSLQVTQKVISINNNIVQANLEILKAKQEGEFEELQALLAMLKKLIDKLLEILNGNSDWLLDISTFQQKKYTKVSQITSELAS